MYTPLKTWLATTPPCTCRCESSPKRGVLQAAWLLRLLTGQRFAEFHCELELLTPTLTEDAAVQFVLRVEAAMTQGLYGKVLQAVASPPSDLFTPFIADLRDTVRYVVFHKSTSI